MLFREAVRSQEGPLFATSLAPFSKAPKESERGRVRRSDTGFQVRIVRILFKEGGQQFGGQASTAISGVNADLPNEDGVFLLGGLEGHDESRQLAVYLHYQASLAEELREEKIAVGGVELQLPCGFDQSE